MMNYNAETYQVESSPYGRIFLAAGILGLILCIVGFFADSHAFYQAYLTAFTFFTTLALGGLFFVLIHFLTGAVWSIVLRRIAGNLAAMLPIMAVFSIPLFFGMQDLFNWADPKYVAQDELLIHKAGFLNPTFFIIRNVVYFAVWSGIVFFLQRYERRLDDGDLKAIGGLRRVSAIGIVLAAFSVTFFGFDWIMSLDAHWYSTMFGVYTFSGGFLASLALVTLIILFYHREQVAADVITREHLHDMGKMMFAFTVWWAYIGGSQYFLIWYANIPEETLWFLHRWEHGWKPVSMALIAIHFVVPFVLLLFQAAKRIKWVLLTVGLLLFAAHYLDHFWMVMPAFKNHGPHLDWMHLAALLGMGGIFGWWVCRGTLSHPLVPVNDPKLKDSIAFSN